MPLPLSHMRLPAPNKYTISKSFQVAFLVTGFLPFTFYAIYHIGWGSLDVGILSLLNMLVIFESLVQHLKGKPLSWRIDVMYICFSASVLYICYVLGYRGLFYICPVIVAVFLNYSLKTALVSSIVFSVLSLLASLNAADMHVVVRASIPIIITLVLSLIYARKINLQEIALEWEANQDYLTGIFNRRSFTRWLRRSIANSNTKAKLVLYFIDIDDFKRVNNSYGHAVGDQLLRGISQRLKSAMRPLDPLWSQLDSKLARIGGDEFIVGVENINNDVHISMIGERLLDIFNKPIVIDNIEHKVHASIGVATAASYDIEPEQLISNADFALLEAKKQSKKCIRYFDQALADELNRKNTIAEALKTALENDTFYLTFMPIYDRTATKIAGAEVLIRNDSQTLSGYGPELYIPIAEEFDLITDIDLLVIEKSFSYMQEILPILSDKTFTLAINISALELKNLNFPVKVNELVKKYNIPPGFIEFEITETSLVDPDDSSINVLNQLKKIGFRLSLDDFGTGYTAFNQLQHYPVDTLKIDRSFVWNIDENTQMEKNKGSMVDVILSLAELYQLNVVAEGVEEKIQLDYLKERNCSYYQGYYLSKPLSWEVFKEVLLE